jgi:DNA repair protein RecO (recombination protein O)
MRSPAGVHGGQDSAELESTVPLITGRAVAGLAAGESLLPVDARAARALMRAALAPLLGPKPLKSRDLFRRLASPPKT